MSRTTPVTNGVSAGPSDEKYDQDALRRDVDAVVRAGSTGVLAEVRTAGGSTVARAGATESAGTRPVPFDAYFRIGDITKVFTATVLLQLVGENRLALTDTVEELLPGLVTGNGNDGRKVTVANLLRQTSGLGEYDKQLPMADDISPDGYRRERFHVFSPGELVALALQQPPQWTPDPADPAGETRFMPSNTNYALAGLIVEQVTGQSWERQVHDRVIEPLRLRHTFTPGTSAYVPQPTATSYSRFPGQTELTETSIIVPPGADRGIISTTADVNRFFGALTNGQLLRADLMARMRDTVEATDWAHTWPGVRYGLGLAWRPTAGSEEGLWFHGGAMPGSVCQVAASADARRTVAVISFTYVLGPEQDAQDHAITTLVDNCLHHTKE